MGHCGQLSRPRLQAVATPEAPVPDAELGVDVQQLGLDRGLADQQLAGCRLIGGAVGDQPQHLDLLRAERVGAVVTGQIDQRASATEGEGTAARRTGTRGSAQLVPGASLSGYPVDSLDSRQHVPAGAVSGQDEHPVLVPGSPQPGNGLGATMVGIRPCTIDDRRKTRSPASEEVHISRLKALTGPTGRALAWWMDVRLMTSCLFWRWRARQARPPRSCGCQLPVIITEDRACILKLPGGGGEGADAGVLVRGAPDQPEPDRWQTGQQDEDDVVASQLLRQ